MDLKNEDNLKNKDALKNEDNLKNEDDLKKKDDLRNQDDLKMKTTLKITDSCRRSWCFLLEPCKRKFYNNRQPKSSLIASRPKNWGGTNYLTNIPTD